MTCKTIDIPQKSRHTCSYVLYMSDKMRHISKLGHMQKKDNVQIENDE